MDKAHSASISEWRIHLGAHKTATTHIQHILADMREGLKGEGLDVLVPHQGLRELSLVRLSARRRKHNFPFLARSKDFTELVAPLLGGQPRVLLSEEALLGWTRDVIRGHFYDNVQFMLSAIGSLSRQSKVKLFLSLRSPDTFLPSIYVETLRHAPSPSAGFATVKSWIRDKPPKWSRLVSEIRRHAPNTELTIWRYEDYRANEQEILSLICGRGVDLPATPPDTSQTRSGSALAVSLVERLSPSLPQSERAMEVASIFSDTSLGSDPFKPFDSEEVESLKLLYKMDLENIRQIAPGSLLF